MSRSGFVVAGGAIMALAAVVATGLVPSRLAAQDAAPVTVVAPQPVESRKPIYFTGSVTSERYAELSPRVSGLVTSVNADAGDPVERGDVLVELDAVLAGLELRRARALLDEARMRLAEAERVRDEAYALGENIPQTELRSREAQVEIEGAVVARLEAEYRQQAERVERHSLVAPFDGVVTRKRTEVGEWVETGTPVLEVVAPEKLRLDVQVPQEHYAAIMPGAPVTVRLDAWPGERFEGRVEAKVPISDSGVRTFLVRVGLDANGRDIIAGMSGEAAFRPQQEQTAFEIPRDSVVRYPDGSTTVWLVEQNDDGVRAVEREVELGRTLSETVEVMSGLSSDALVIVRGNELLEEGQPVRVVEDETPQGPGETTG